MNRATYLCLASILSCGLVGCNQISKNDLETKPTSGTQQVNTTNQNDGVSLDAESNAIFSKETDYPIVGGIAEFTEVSHNLDELYQKSEVIAEIIVTEQQIIPLTEEDAHTDSVVKIVQLLKGDSRLNSITVTEFGGPMDFTKVYEKYKDKPGDDANLPKPKIVEVTLNWSPTMKKGNTYIVFLKRNEEVGMYNLTGSVQGKIKVDTKTNRMVATVDGNYLNDDLFFLQKQFAGKNKSVLIKEIKSLGL